MYGKKLFVAHVSLSAFRKKNILRHFVILLRQPNTGYITTMNSLKIIALMHGDKKMVKKSQLKNRINHK